MFKWELINDDTGEREILLTDPHGWEDVSLEHNRSEKYDGIFLDFSRDLSFHCKGGGKEMLDEIYEDKGSEGNATLKCYFSCGGGNFKLLFEGFVNFASYKEEFRGKTLHTTVEIRKKGITQTVMSRDETDVDLLSEVSIGGVALNAYGYAPYVMNLHSKIIRLDAKWHAEPFTSNSETFLQGPSIMGTGTTRRFFHTQPVPVTGSDLEKSFDSSEFWEFTSDAIAASQIQPIHDTSLASPRITPAVYDWEFSTSGTFNWYSNGATTGVLDVALVIRVGRNLANQNEILLQSIFSGLITGNETVDYNISSSGSVTVNDNEKIWIHWTVTYQSQVGTGADQFAAEFEVDDFDFLITSDTVIASSECKTVAIHEAWSRVCEGITDQTLAFKSEFFGRKNSQGLKYNQNGYGSFTAITDGLRIRGFEKSTDAVLTDGQTKKGIITTLKDMYDSCNAVWGIGLGIETHDGTEVVRVEEKDHYYQDVEIIKIPNIPNLEMQFAEDMAFSEVQLGYEKWRTESKGGLDEPLTMARWIFPKIKNIKNVKELTSPFVGGMYPIEETRRAQKKFNFTGDTDYDDDIFFIATSRTREDVVPNTELTIAEKNENICVDPTTLLAPDTAYNLRFNLFSNFDRTMNQFTTNLTKDSPQQIKYSYLEGNGQMTFAYFETSYDQSGNLNKLGVKNVQDTEIPSGYHQRQYPILLPEVYTFTYALPFSDYLTLLDNPYGYISFSSTKKNYKKGYIKEMSYNIARQMAEFTLIRKFD